MIEGLAISGRHAPSAELMSRAADAELSLDAAERHAKALCTYLAHAAERSDLLVRLQLSVIRNEIEQQRSAIAMLRDADWDGVSQ